MLVSQYILHLANMPKDLLTNQYTHLTLEELEISIQFHVFQGISLVAVNQIFETFGRLLSMVFQEHYESCGFSPIRVYLEIKEIGSTVRKTHIRTPRYPSCSCNIHLSIDTLEACTI